MNTGSFVDGGGNHHEVALAADRDHNTLVSSLRRAWRSEFPGTALNPQRWQVISQGAGQSISFLNNELRINAGVVAGEDFIMRSVSKMSIPFRAWFILRLSQRIANQEIRLEAINAAGDMIAGWLLDGTTATNAKYYSANSGYKTTSGSATTQTTASNAILELEMFPDEFWAVSRLVDSSSQRQNVYVKVTNIPDPEEDYFLQVRVTNLATAPASDTQITINAVAVQDINELTAEITGGRGDSVGAKAIAVAGAVSVVSTTLTGATAYGSSVFAKVISAATTNATLILTAAHALHWLSAANNSATWRYLKLYNKATAPVPGTDVPVYVIGIPPGQSMAITNAVGMRFSLGIGLAITGGIADADTTAIGANEVVVSLNYV